jgi:hypothetical protein
MVSQVSKLPSMIWTMVSMNQDYTV